MRSYYRYWGLAAVGVLSIPAAADAFAGAVDESTIPTASVNPAPASQPTAGSSAESSRDQANAEGVLRAGTPVILLTNDSLSSQSAKVGDKFGVTVASAVTEGSVVGIPMGTTGYGEITFVTDNGSFGKPGILMIALRFLDIGGRQVALDGRYREEGANKNDETAATMFAVGVFAAAIKGKPALIPAGRQLIARTGEDFPITAPAAPLATIAAPPDSDAGKQSDQP